MRAAAPWGRPLPRDFYARGAAALARALLGRVLVRDHARGRVAGRIVEVEAYEGARDPASHAFRGRTPRTAVMFGPPGYAYVYFTYGMHHCLNVVARADGVPAAVLIRALEPLEGIELMRERRGGVPDDRLARGPGCVAEALALRREHDGADLVTGALWIGDAAPRRGGHRLACGPRIGIRVGVETPWRFWLAGHPGVSGPKRAMAHRVRR